MRIFIFSLLWVISLATQAQVRHDRVWWNTSDVGERTQFVAGYIDCAVYDQEDSHLEYAQWNEVERRITQFYSAHAETHRDVGSLISKFGRDGKLPAPGGERFLGPHGIFDGDYWWQLDAPERAGFVEGYFNCLEHFSGGMGVRHASVAWYVDKVNEFYCFTGDACALERIPQNSRAPEKIAVVLRRLRDTSTSRRAEEMPYRPVVP
jgi:hypothetical protein